MVRSGVRKRYIAFKVLADEPHTKHAIFNAINSAINSATSPYNPLQSKINLRLLEYDVESGRGILVCGHKMVEPVRKSISAIAKIADSPVEIRVIGVSGTIRCLCQKFH